MDPLAHKPEGSSENLPTEEGYVYGHAPKQPEAPPDIESMFEAAGVPGPMEGGSPFTAEWYAGAQDRAIARDKEMQELLERKDTLRTDWADLVSGDLASWANRVSIVAGEPQRVGGLAELLARTAHERPGETERIQDLQNLLLAASKERARCEKELDKAARHLKRNEDAVRAKEVENRAEEEERKEEKRKADARRRKAERLLERQAAMMRGEEPEPSDGEDEEGAAAVTVPPAPAEAPVAELPGSGAEDPGRPAPPPSLSPPPGAVPRGGATAMRTLPPLRDAPVPPPA